MTNGRKAPMPRRAPQEPPGPASPQTAPAPQAPGGAVVVRGRFTAPVDPEAIARDWAQRGFSCRLWVDAPGQEWNDFVHATRELVTVVEGRLDFEVGGQRLELVPGDELLIPRDARHSVKNVHRGTSRWLYGYGR